MSIATGAGSALYLGHATTSRAVPTEGPGRKGVGRRVARRGAAGPGGPPRLSAAAPGPWGQRAHGGAAGAVDPAGDSQDRPPLPHGRPAQRPVRAAAPRGGRGVGARGETAHRRDGLQRPAAGRGAVDGPLNRAGGGEATTGASGGTRDDPRALAIPRPETVAGKKKRADRPLPRERSHQGDT